jgi:hypothetical protein
VPSATFLSETIRELPATVSAKKRGRLNGSEEEQDGSEEERNEEHRERRLAWLEEWKEIEQIVVPELVAILGRQEAEKALMALRACRLWG